VEGGGDIENLKLQHGKSVVISLKKTNIGGGAVDFFFGSMLCSVYCRVLWGFWSIAVGRKTN